MQEDEVQNEVEYDQQVPDLDVDPSNPIVDMIQAIQQKDFNNAEKSFQTAINDKLQDTLDQARARIAGQVFNPSEEEADEYEAEEQEIEAEADAEVEAEVEEEQPEMPPMPHAH